MVHLYYKWQHKNLSTWLMQCFMYIFKAFGKFYVLSIFLCFFPFLFFIPYKLLCWGLTFNRLQQGKCSIILWIFEHCLHTTYVLDSWCYSSRLREVLTSKLLRSMLLSDTVVMTKNKETVIDFLVHSPARGSTFN